MKSTMNGLAIKYILTHASVMMQLLLLLCVTANVSAQQKSSPVNKNSQNEITLRNDGLYNTFDTSMGNDGVRNYNYYSLREILVFLNSKSATYEYAVSYSNFDPLDVSYYDDRFLLQSIGSYSQKNNKVMAVLPIGLAVWGMRIKQFTAHFEGEIKNKDTIINWRMIEPFPNAPKKFNNNFKGLTTPKMLYFIKSNELLGLDSLYQQRLTKYEKNKS